MLKKTLKNISRETRVAKSTVHHIIKRYRKNNSLDRVGISGRKKILNDKDVSYLINDIKKIQKVHLIKLEKNWKIQEIRE